MTKIYNEAYREIAASDLPPELWPGVIGKGIERLLGATVAERMPQMAEKETVDESGLAALAKKTRVDKEALADVFEADDGEIQLIVGPARLPRQRAAASRTIALLIASARQGSGLDSGWTSVASIREAAREYGAYDEANFAGTVASMNDVFAFKGSGQKRQIKVTARGFEQFANLVNSLVNRG
jgi:hypothetical protein